MHRHALHQKLDSMQAPDEIRARGQTAGVGIRLNPKLANLPPMRNGLSSQSNVASKRGIRGA